MKIKLITDSASDLSIDVVKKYNIEVLPIRVNYKGEDIADDLGQTSPPQEFYKALREGEMPSTSQVNAFTYEVTFRKYLEEGYTVLYIGLSSKLSGSVVSAFMAQNTILADNPEAPLVVIDTKSGSLGESLLVTRAAELIENGAELEEVVAWVESAIPNIQHWIAIDDLKHLQRGGRLSNAGAIFGSLLSVKPITMVNAEGSLVPVEKVKGRKKSIQALVDKALKCTGGTIYIAHADCYEDAVKVKEALIENGMTNEIVIQYFGPTVGSHAGPGALGVFFVGEERK